MKSLQVLGLCLLSFALAQNSSWQRMAPLKTPRQEVGVAVLEGKIYVAGGLLGNGATSGALEVYDPKANQWTTLEPLPVPVHHPAAVGLDGKLYVLGGYRVGFSDTINAVQIYDPASQKWNKGTPLPTSRAALSAVVLEGKIYAVGGVNGHSTAELAVFEPKSKAWKTLPPMPTPRDHSGAAVIEGKVYVAGGRKDGVFDLRNLEVYDPKTAQWEVLAPMPTGRSGHAVGAIGDCLYAISGEGNPQAANGMFVQVEAYNTKTKRWASLSAIPSPKHGTGAAVIGAQIFLPGGGSSASIDPTFFNDLFIPPPCA